MKNCALCCINERNSDKTVIKQENKSEHMSKYVKIEVWKRHRKREEGPYLLNFSSRICLLSKHVNVKPESMQNGWKRG